MTAQPGRKPKPPALKLLEGRAPGRDSGGRKVPASLGFVRLPPEPPYFLEGEALAEWHRVVPELARLELLKPVDSAALSAYCVTWARFVDAQAIVARDGLTHSNSQGLTRHPAVAIVEAASKELRAWAAEFGLTPSAESRVVRAEAADGDEANPFA